MTESNLQSLKPLPKVERLIAFTSNDLNDLCDATDAAIVGGGGFGWTHIPSRDILERFWQGVVAMPSRILLVARLDGVICGTCQLIKPTVNNEAQAHAVQLTTNFVAPWARGHGLARQLLREAENVARKEGFSVINLDVRETMIAAIELYETSGFQRFGELR
ncbi:MAG: GNAT family N-acetyltransferase [Alphaproteobacteria bacterium]|nr:GNAT family N-acetyltransferase [Alphaproteobacteria bacterium]